MCRLFSKFSVVAITFLLVACGGDKTGNTQLEAAKTYLQEGKSKEAVIELKNALQNNPKLAEARFLLGKHHFSRGAYADAEKELKKAQEFGATNEELLPLLSRTYLIRGDDALLALSADGLSGESKAVVLASQGLKQLRNGEKEKAKQLINDAIEANSNSAYALVAKARLVAVDSKGDFSAVRAQLQKAFDASPDYSDAWSLLGDIELRDANPEKAEAAYTKALSDPSRLEDRYKRALVRLQKNDMDGAKEDVSALLKKAPNSLGGQYVNGILLFKEDKLKDAITAFDIAQRNEDRFPMSLFYLATAHGKLGNAAQAEEYAYRYLAVSPSSVAGRKLLATIKLDANDGAEAEELIRPVYEANKNDLDALSLLSSALLKQNKKEEGIKLLRELVAAKPESSEVKTRLAGSLLATGDVPGSIKYIREALKIDPNYTKAYLLLVSAHLKKNDIKGAFATIDEFEKNVPNKVAPHNMRGQVYLAQKKFVEARSAFNQALGVSKSDPLAHDKLAMLDIENKDYPAAEGHYRAILEGRPDYLPAKLKLVALAELQKNYDGMEKLLGEAIEEHPNEVQPRVMLSRLLLTRGEAQKIANTLSPLDTAGQNHPDVLNVAGLAYLELGEYVNAKTNFEKLIAKLPSAPQPHHHLALSHRGLKDAKKEKAEFTKAVELAPGYIEPRIELTRILLREEDKKGAAKHLAELRKMVPEHPEVLQLEAVRLAREGKNEASLALSEKAFDIAPTARNLLVLVQQNWVMKKPDTSKSLMQDWLKKNPNDVPVRHELASFEMGTKNNDAAITQYREIVKIAPKNVLGLNNLAWLLKDKEPKEALGFAEKAVEYSEKSPLTLDTLAMVKLANGDAKGASRTMSKALDKISNVSMRYHSAQIDNALGEKDRAVKTLRALLKEGKNFEERKAAEQLLKELQ